MPEGLIGVEGKWELKDAQGNRVDGAMPHERRARYTIHRLLGQAVTRFEIDPPASFTLHFTKGDRLTVFDESEYESFSIQPANIFV
jgi:hypothetical protein